MRNVFFQHDKAPCYKAKVISNRFPEHDNEFSVLVRFPFTSSESDRTPLGCGRMGDSQHESVSKKKICRSCMMQPYPYGPESQRKCFQHFVESVL